MKFPEMPTKCRKVKNVGVRPPPSQRLYLIMVSPLSEIYRKSSEDFSFGRLSFVVFKVENGK